MILETLLKRVILTENPPNTNKINTIKKAASELAAFLYLYKLRTY